jgi:uncharacterized protein YxeA
MKRILLVIVAVLAVIGYVLTKRKKIKLKQISLLKIMQQYPLKQHK